MMTRMKECTECGKSLREGDPDLCERCNEQQNDDYEALTGDQRVQYVEAIRCGASHNDAMEAAETNGYAGRG